MINYIDILLELNKRIIILIVFRLSIVKIQKFKENKLSVYIKIEHSNKKELEFHIGLKLQKYCMLVIELDNYRLDLKLEMIAFN